MAHKQIRELFLEDFNDRKIKYPNIKKIDKKHEERLVILRSVLNKKPKLSPIDIHRVAFMFLHSSLISEKKKAKKYAYKNICNGYNKSKWLYAIIVDRILVLQGKKQKFGTQYEKHRGKLRLHPWDKRTTDKERLKYNIPPIQEILDEIPHLTPWWKQKSKKHNQ